MKLHDYLTESEQAALLQLTGGDPLELDQNPPGAEEASEEEPDDPDEDRGHNDDEGGEEEAREIDVAFVAAVTNT
jgi:hypothetical protein